MLFSVIIPTRNRPRQLQRCLAALASIRYPKDNFEVIVVEDGGCGDPAPAAEPFREKLSIRLLLQSHRGPAAARNNGARNAAGRFLAFTDDDCEPEANWLQAFEAAIRARPDHLLGGTVKNALAASSCAAASQLIHDFTSAQYNRDPDAARFFPSNNIAVVAAAFQRVGGFDEGFQLSGGEDRNFCDLWRSRGGRMSCAPEAIVWHRHEMGLRGFLTQHFNYGRGGFSYRLARLRRGAGPVPFEGWPFHLGLLAAPLQTGAKLSLTVLVALSQAAVASGYFYEAIAGRRPTVLAAD